jgi:site-specific DNA recombinase
MFAKSEPHNAVIYTRVSTTKQLGADHHSLDSQLDSCKGYCKLYNYNIISIHSDEGVSGLSTNHRDGLADALAALSDGDSLIVYSISRLSRNMCDFTRMLQEFRQRGNHLVSVSEHFDSSTPNGELMMHILASFSAFESRTTAKRVKDTMQYMKTQGRIFGPVPYGYMRDPKIKGMLLPNNDEQIIVQIIVTKRDEEQMKWCNIVRLLNSEGYTKRNGKPWDAPTVTGIYKRFADMEAKIEKNNTAVLEKNG